MLLPLLLVMLLLHVPAIEFFHHYHLLVHS
jgi:hypothetical protein